MSAKSSDALAELVDTDRSAPPPGRGHLGGEWATRWWTSFCSEEALDGIRVERDGQVEALPALAAEPLEQLQLVGVLDALGDRPQPQRPTHPQHRVHEHGAVGMRVDAVDEALVDLQHVDRELLQVRQRRVPRAEVIERDADPEPLELVQACDRVRVRP